MKNTVYLMMVCLGWLAISCTKTAGEGGQASIKGKVWVEDWNTGFTIKNGEYAGADYDVYIIYGDNVSYGDKIKASYDGQFEFKFLRKGNYKVYVYSKDKSLQSQSGDTVFVQSVTLEARKDIVTLETFTVYK